jgi:hypothetical protein
MKAPCPRCGLELAGRQPHETPEDCLRHLAPRYRMAQDSLEHMHKRYRLLEERLERTQIAWRVAKKAATALRETGPQRNHLPGNRPRPARSRGIRPRAQKGIRTCRSLIISIPPPRMRSR